MAVLCGWRPDIGRISIGKRRQRETATAARQAVADSGGGPYLPDTTAKAAPATRTMMWGSSAPCPNCRRRLLSAAALRDAIWKKNRQSLDCIPATYRNVRLSRFPPRAGLGAAVPVPIIPARPSRLRAVSGSPDRQGRGGASPRPQGIAAPVSLGTSRCSSLFDGLLDAVVGERHRRPVRNAASHRLHLPMKSDVAEEREARSGPWCVCCAVARFSRQPCRLLSPEQLVRPYTTYGLRFGNTRSRLAATTPALFA